MAELVFCRSCKQVVWANDVITQDVRGVLNEMKMPCPECGEQGTFDGFGKAEADWLWLQNIASFHKLTWAISPDGVWFHRPDRGDYTDLVQGVVQRREFVRP